MVIDESERESKLKVCRLQKSVINIICTWLKLWVLRTNYSSTLTLIKCVVHFLKDTKRPCEVIMTQCHNDCTCSQGGQERGGGEGEGEGVREKEREGGGGEGEERERGGRGRKEE